MAKEKVKKIRTLDQQTPGNVRHIWQHLMGKTLAKAKKDPLSYVGYTRKELDDFAEENEEKMAKKDDTKYAKYLLRKKHKVVNNKSDPRTEERLQEAPAELGAIRIGPDGDANALGPTTVQGQGKKTLGVVRIDPDADVNSLGPTTVQGQGKKKMKPDATGESVQYEAMDLIVSAARQKPDDVNVVFANMLQDILQGKIAERKLELQQSFLGVVETPQEEEVEEETPDEAVEEEEDAEELTGDLEDETEE